MINPRIPIVAWISANHGDAVAEQAEAILKGEAVEEQNPNALRIIAHECGLWQNALEVRGIDLDDFHDESVDIMAIIEEA